MSASTISASLVVLWLLASMVLWFLAFYQPVAPAEWLSTLQSVCFGTNESGLPDASGWMILVLGPVSLLLAVLVALGREVSAGWRILWGSPLLKIVMVFLLLAVATELLWATTEVRQRIKLARVDYSFDDLKGLPFQLERTSKPSPDYELVNQSGELISPQMFQGKVVYLTFAFAHCQTVCPAIVKSVQNATREFSEEDIGALVITLDPWRDTPSSLERFAKHFQFSENMHVLSGEVETVVSVLDEFGITRSRDEKTGDVIHPALVYVLDREGRIAFTLDNPSSHWLIEAAKRLSHEPSEGVL